MPESNSTKEIQELRDDKKYYGEYGKEWLSNSDITQLLNDEQQYGVPVKETEAMIKGRYFHQLVLEPEKAKDFVIWTETETRGKAYKEFCKENNYDVVLKQSEADEIKAKADWFMSPDNPKLKNNKGEDISWYDIINGFGVKKEEPAIGEIFGHKFKGKADLVTTNPSLIVDLKTTADIRRFPSRVKWENGLDSQAFIYHTLFKKPFVFITIGETQKQYSDGEIYYDVGIHFVPDEVILRGKKKVLMALQTLENLKKPDYKKSVILNETLT